MLVSVCPRATIISMMDGDFFIPVTAARNGGPISRISSFFLAKKAFKAAFKLSKSQAS